MLKLIARLAILMIAVSFVVFSGGCVPADPDLGAGDDVSSKPNSGDSPVSKSGMSPSKSRSGSTPAPKALAQTELKALDGEDFKIADLKGKVVLINLWATWCAPCIEEMPYFNKLQEKYGDQGFQVLGLNSDEETDAQVRQFVKEQKLNYKIGWAKREVTDEFVKISKLPGIPQSLLLNRNGEMTGLFRGGGQNVILKMVESVDKLMSEESDS
jgi:thiol-disulfide isomerase/thioredoxin